MANLATNKKYLNIDGVRVSYQAKDNTIHITSTDDDFPEGFHLTLTQGSPSEDKLRSLLTEHGLIRSEQVVDKIPKFVRFDADSAALSPWNIFPLGRNEKEEIYWDAKANPNLLVLGNKGSGRTVLKNLLINHVTADSDNWSKPIVINGTITDTDTNSINDDLYLNKLYKKIRKINNLIVERSVYFDKDIPANGQNFSKRVLIVVEDLNKIINNPLLTQRARETIQALNATITQLSMVGHRLGLHVAMFVGSHKGALPSETIMNHMYARLILKRVSKELSLEVLDTYQASETVSGIVGRGVYQTVNGFSFPFQTYYIAEEQKKDKEDSHKSSVKVSDTSISISNQFDYCDELDYAIVIMKSILKKEGPLHKRDLLKKTSEETSFPDLEFSLNDALSSGKIFRDKNDSNLFHNAK